MTIFKFIIWICFGFLIYKGVQSCKRNGYHQVQGKTRHSDIYSLKTMSSVNGVFVLGIGSIGSDDYYVFYRRTGSGGLIREKIRTSNCIIYENSNKPSIIEVGEISYHLIDGDTVSSTFSRNDYSGYMFSIFVPKGTITERINDVNLN